MMGYLDKRVKSGPRGPFTTGLVKNREPPRCSVVSAIKKIRCD